MPETGRAKAAAKPDIRMAASAVSAAMPAVLLAAVLLIAGFAPGCTYSQSRVVRPGTLSPTLAPMVFKEEGGLILMTVGVVATRFHGEHPFIPLEVCIANKGVTPYISLSRESLYLMDTFGRRYGMAGVEEVRRLQPNTSLDRRMTGAEFNAMKLSAYQPVESQFFPLAGAALLRDHVELHRFAGMCDILYFPRPEGELNGGIFELHLMTRGLPEEIFVVFEVPRE